MTEPLKPMTDRDIAEFKRQLETFMATGNDVPRWQGVDRSLAIRMWNDNAKMRAALRNVWFGMYWNEYAKPVEYKDNGTNDRWKPIPKHRVQQQFCDEMGVKLEDCLAWGVFDGDAT